jgi:hypothetical protein
MSRDELSARHRKCLENARRGGPSGENEAQLYTGEKIRLECLDRSWLERLPDSPAGFRMYRTTELGRAMLNAQPPTRAKAGPKIEMLRPRIKTLDTRTVKPLPRKK